MKLLVSQSLSRKKNNRNWVSIFEAKETNRVDAAPGSLDAAGSEGRGPNARPDVAARLVIGCVK